MRVVYISLSVFVLIKIVVRECNVPSQCERMAVPRYTLLYVSTYKGLAIKEMDGSNPCDGK